MGNHPKQTEGERTKVAINFKRMIQAFAGKITFLFFIGALLLSSTAFCAEHPLVKYLPQNPLVVLSAEDFSRTYQSLTALPAASAHRDSADRQSFDKSKLALKFKERARELGEFAGHKIDLETLTQLSGKHITLALYDIGELRFLLLTDLNAKGQAGLDYLKKYDSLDTRTIGDRTYFVKDPEKGLSIALYRDNNFMAVSNDISLIESALLARDDPNFESGFTKDIDWAAANESAPVILLKPTLLYLNMKKLLEDRYFRHYWVYRNLELLQNQQGVFVGLEMDSQRIYEKRLVIGPSRYSGPGFSADDSIGAWWSTAKPTKPTVEMVREYFGWPQWNELSKLENSNRLMLCVLPKKQNSGIISFKKGAVIHSDGDITAQGIGQAIISSINEKMLIPAPSIKLVLSRSDQWAIQALPELGGIYLAQKGQNIFIANDREYLQDLLKKVVETEKDIVESAFVPLDEPASLWGTALVQMGPTAAFSEYDAGIFYQNEIASILFAASKFKSFHFRIESKSEERVIQEVIYEK
jgi:hypothetical protein